MIQHIIYFTFVIILIIVILIAMWQTSLSLERLGEYTKNYRRIHIIYQHNDEYLPKSHELPDETHNEKQKNNITNYNKHCTSYECDLL